MKTVYDLGKKLVTIDEMRDYFKIDHYGKLVALVNLLVEQGTLTGVKASKSNGMNPPLYNRYRINPRVEDLSYLEAEINYKFPLNCNREYYLANLQRYLVDKEAIDKLISYIRDHKQDLVQGMSINERSFAIWGQEKYLRKGHGETILNNLGLSLADLNIYQTPEPFVYFSLKKERNQRILIVENKDTWYTLRKLMLEGYSSFFGQALDTIIYGSGKTIERSLEDYHDTVEEYLLEPAQVMYWGDIDYEGIAIYERLKNRYRGSLNIELFKPAYEAMVELAQGRPMPQSKEEQNKNIQGIFLAEMQPYNKKILDLLEEGRYIPQEIVNYQVLRKEIAYV